MRVLHVLPHPLAPVAALLEHQAALGLSPVSLILGGAASPADGDVLDHDAPLIPRALQMALLGHRILAMHREAPLFVIHAHAPLLCGLPSHAAARWVGVPRVYEMRAFWEDMVERRGHGRHTSGRYAAVRAIETRLARSADAVVAASEGIRRELLARGLPGDRVFLIPCGVDTGRFAPRLRDEALVDRYGLRDKLVVAHLGPLSHLEGIPLLLEAFRDIAETRDDVRCLVAGSGDADHEVREARERLGLADKVVLAGDLPPAEAASLADVVVCPRLRHRITELTTPPRALEAMSAGKLVVGSDVGGLRELIREGETGLLFRAGDAGDLARALRAGLRDVDLRRRAGERARAHVLEHHDARRLAGRYLEVYATARAARKAAA